MKKLKSENQGGYSYIGLWPWTGVYSALSLYLSGKFGVTGFVGITVVAAAAAIFAANKTEAAVETAVKSKAPALLKKQTT